MQLACLIILLVILVLVLFCLGVLISMLYQDKKQESIMDMFLKCFDDMAHTIADYYELMEKLIKKNNKRSKKKEDK